MPISQLSDGRFEAAVCFGRTSPRHFVYETKVDAQALVDAEPVFNSLSSSATQHQCTDAQIMAAADALLRIPCGSNTELYNWARMTEHFVRSKAKASQVKHREYSRGVR